MEQNGGCVIAGNKLSGFNTAFCILKHLLRGESEKEIAEKKFNGDGQLVSMWMLFLKYNHWLEQHGDGKWKISEKGKRWLHRCQKMQ